MLDHQTLLYLVIGSTICLIYANGIYIKSIGGMCYMNLNRTTIYSLNGYIL